MVPLNGPIGEPQLRWILSVLCWTGLGGMGSDFKFESEKASRLKVHLRAWQVAVTQLECWRLRNYMPELQHRHLPANISSVTDKGVNVRTRRDNLNLSLD
jgi:hypothetical protein